MITLELTINEHIYVKMPSGAVVTLSSEPDFSEPGTLRIRDEVRVRDRAGEAAVWAWVHPADDDD